MYDHDVMYIYLHLHVQLLFHDIAGRSKWISQSGK